MKRSKKGPRPRIEVRERGTDKVIEEILLTTPGSRHADRVLSGLRINMDRARFYAVIVDVAEVA